MEWQYKELAEDTIRKFVKSCVPDARDWENQRYRVSTFEEGELKRRITRVEFDIPTSGEDCWLTFEIATDRMDEDGVVKLYAIRGGEGVNEGTTYVCSTLDGVWVPAPYDLEEGEFTVSDAVEGLTTGLRLPPRES